MAGLFLNGLNMNVLHAPRTISYFPKAFQKGLITTMIEIPENRDVMYKYLFWL